MNENPFSQYPLYLKATDIMDMLQICKNSAYKFMEASGLLLGGLGKSKRVPRDKFMKWLLEQEGKYIA